MHDTLTKLFLDASFSDELVRQIRARAREVPLKKNEVLIPQGLQHKYVYLIETGSLVKYLTTREGSKVPVWFYFDALNDIVLCPDGFFQGKPTKYEVVALENTLVLQVSKLQMDLWLSEFPEFHNFYLERIIAGTIATDEMRACQLAYPPLEFLDYLDQEYPVFRQRLSSKNMARFIGVSPEWYSKLKRRR